MTIARQFGTACAGTLWRIETGLLGNKIVEISVNSPTAPPVQPNDVIDSRDPFDIGRVMNKRRW
jgi:hypothetical protein